jgi:hypothetical protein
MPIFEKGAPQYFYEKRLLTYENHKLKAFLLNF